jgi:4-hydroxy-tetrahydrodipicolinate reductase
MRILLVGYGKMGRLVDDLAAQYGCEVVGILDPNSPRHGGGPTDERWEGVEVAIDFSTPDSVMTNAPVLARRGINLVLGTTGWGGHEAALRHMVEDAGEVGVVAAPNFSSGVVIFESIVKHAAKLFAAQSEFGAFLHESHHAAKKDAPSGTAILLKRAMEHAGYARAIDVSSARAGYIPGTHTVAFDGPAETVTLTHTARDRTAFARGALVAARWINGRRGWFTMRDVLGTGDD